MCDARAAADAIPLLRGSTLAERVDDAAGILETGVLALAEWHTHEDARAVVKALIDRAPTPLKCLCLEAPCIKMGEPEMTVLQISGALIERSRVDVDDIEEEIGYPFARIKSTERDDEGLDEDLFLVSIAAKAISKKILVAAAEDPKLFFATDSVTDNLDARDKATAAYLVSVALLKPGTLLLWGASHFYGGKAGCIPTEKDDKRRSTSLRLELDLDDNIRRAGELYEGQAAVSQSSSPAPKASE